MFDDQISSYKTFLKNMPITSIKISTKLQKDFSCKTNIKRIFGINLFCDEKSSRMKYYNLCKLFIKISAYNPNRNLTIDIKQTGST